MNKRNYETPEQLRLFQKRLEKRERTLTWNQKIRNEKRKEAEEKALSISIARKILRKDKSDEKKKNKRPGHEKFLAAFSFIPAGSTDTRHLAVKKWKCRSFNEQRQYIDFLKIFIYPYNVPAPLLFASLLPEHTFNDKNQMVKSPHLKIIRMAKEWLVDIVSGESFYKRNKEYFTKAEAHYFLNTNLSFSDGTSVIKMFFDAKCKARHVGHSLRILVVKVFTVKFLMTFNNPVVLDFLDFIARNQGYRFTSGELGDVCDFIITKLRGKFSFSGRTVTSIVAFANEWHAELHRPIIIHNGHQQGNTNKNAIALAKWNGLPILKFRYEEKESTWEITQLYTAQDLLNEGRKMKNCVASYSWYCAGGEGAIFNVSEVSTYKESEIRSSRATLQVSSSRVLVQAKSKCNGVLEKDTKRVVSLWANSNRIKIQLV
jgi:hypothetical protein